MKEIDILAPIYGRKAYLHKNKSALVKSLCLRGDISIEEMAGYFGCAKGTLDSKIHRNSLALDEFIIAAWAAGYKIGLVNENEFGVIDIHDYFKDEPWTMERLEKYDAAVKDRKRRRLR